MNKFFRHITAPIIVAVIMAAFYMLYGIYPFGEKTIAWCDMEQQVIPLFIQLKDILSGKESILYSTVNDGGMNFWGVFLFFISSPLSLIVAFVEKSDMTAFMNIFVVLKMMLCAFTASFFFRHEIKNLSTGFNILLSVMYACSGYTMMFYQNIIWLDIMCLFPLVMLAHRRMLDERKPFWYIITLSIFVSIQFYLAYMLAIFLIIETYFYIRNYHSTRKKNDALFIFMSSSFVSILLTAVILIPSLMQYLNSARDTSLIYSLQSSGIFAIAEDKLELIMCSAIIFSAIPFLALKKLRQFLNNRVKQLSYSLLFLAIPLIVEPVNKMWHTGSYQCFPLRYGYIPILIGLTIVGYIISDEHQPDSQRSEFSKKIVKLSAIIAITACIAFSIYGILHITSKMAAYTSSLWTNHQQFFNHVKFVLIFSAGYLLCIIALKSNLFNRKTAVSAMFVICICEIFVNSSVFIGNAANTDKLFQTTMQLENAINDNEYCRVKMDKKYMHANMIGALGYNTLGHYTSFTGQDYIFTMKKLGYSSYWMEVGSNGGTRITDAILSNKYSIGSKNFTQKYAELTYTNSMFNIYRNELCMPMGTILSENLTKNKIISFTDRISVQEYYAKEFLGDESIVQNYDYKRLYKTNYSSQGGMHSFSRQNADSTDSSILYEFYVSGNQELYLDIFNELTTETWESHYKSVAVYVNGIEIENEYPTQIDNGFLRLGTFNNENITVKIKLLNDFSVKSFGVFGVNLDKLSTSLDKMNTVEVTHDKNKLYAECDAKDGEYLYLSVPYEKGFTVTNNGEQVKALKANGCFTAIKLNEGSNKIKFTFYPQGFKLGTVISIVGMVLCAVFVLIIKKTRLSKSVAVYAGKAINLIFSTAFFAVIAIIYIMPVLISIAGYFKKLL